MMHGTETTTHITMESIEAFIAAKRDGRLHVFRLRIVCPCCSSIWYQDILEVPDKFEIPDRRRMGLAMLCGSCEARRMTRFVVPGKDGWNAPFLTPGEIAQAWAKLLGAPKGSWIRVEDWTPDEAATRCPWDGQTELRDDRRDLFRACTTRGRDGRRYNVTAMTAETLTASGLGWKTPPAPVGIASGESW